MREDDTQCCGPKFWVYLIICLVLVAFSGLTSGLSLGLFSYTQVDLEVLIKAGLPQERKYAARILPIVKNEYLLLCTLLIGKSLALETLPIFLDRLLPFWATILVSVTFIIAFAEVIPQAVCSRYGLSLSAKFVLFVRLLLLVLFPLAYPVSKLLDWLLGKGHSELLRRAQLKTLVDLHSVKAGRGGELTDDETTIIAGALDMTQKTAKDAMTPITKTFSLDINSKLDMQTMGLIASQGHSRVPIYSGNRNNIIGLILVKTLMFCHPEDEIPIKNLNIRRISRVHDNWPLYDVLKLFQKGHNRMAVVLKSSADAKEAGGKDLFSSSETHTPVLPIIKRQGEQEGGNFLTESLESFQTKLINEEIIGIITMADVMKELLQEEIVDESDLNSLHKLRINFLPWRRSASSSPGVGSIYWRTPAASPFSSQYHTPVLHSPVAQFVPSPLVRPILYASPRKSNLGSPGGAFPVRDSPLRQVLGKSYDRLRTAGAS